MNAASGVGRGRVMSPGCGGLGDVSEHLPELAVSLRRLTEARLRELVGAGSFQRGLAYSREHRVSDLRVLGPGGMSATVRGSDRSYRTSVEFDNVGVFVGGGCTCPIGGDCKHVVAVALTAQQTLGLAGAAVRNGLAARPVTQHPLAVLKPVPPEWERLLGGLASSPPASVRHTPVGLLLEVRAPRTDRYAADPANPTSRVMLRPMLPGKTGWIKTGISWSQLSYLGYGAAHPDPRHVQALQTLLSLAGAQQRYYGTADALGLDQLGDGWAAALRHCRTAGVTLLAAPRGGGEVRIAQEPARVSIDLIRTPERAVRVAPSVSLPEELNDPETRTWVGIGSPPSGLWTRRGADLWLAAFEQPLDADTARLLRHGPVDVPPVDVARFLGAVVPVLARRFTVTSPDASVEIAAVAPPGLHVTITHLSGVELRLQWTVHYAVGAETVDIAVGSRDHATLRDEDAEDALLAAVVGILPPMLVRPAGPDRPPGPYPTSTLAGFDVIDFLDRVVPQLEHTPGVTVAVTGDVVTYAEAEHPPMVRLSLTDSDNDWFDLTVSVTVGAEDVPIADLVTALTLRQEQLILPSGTWFRLDRPELIELRRLLDEARALQDTPRGPLRLSRYQADLWAELEALGVVEEQGERWQAAVKALSATVREPVAAPSGLLATLRPYQHEGFEWLTFLRREGLGGLLADDMGLGKTLQTLAMILQERADAAGQHAVPQTDPDDDAPRPAAGGPRAPWLVVAPASVLGVWESEARRFAPELKVAVASTTGKRKSGVADVAAGADLVVTSYAVFRFDADAFRELAWAGLILDEAQAVKNHQSATYQCARRLAAPVKYAITGTPMENNLMELWALLSIVAPGLFPRPDAFTEHFRRPIENGSHPERLDTLRRRIRPVMLRRTKAAVAADLPPKQEQLVHVELPPRHRRLYDRGLARERQRVLGLLEDPSPNRIAIFRALTVLRRLSLHPGLVDAEHRDLPCAKLDTLLELMVPVLAEGHQVLVFSQFTSFLGLLRTRLDAEGIGYSYLDGRTRRRDEVVEEFRRGDTSVFLISLKAGGVGLTLTEADYVFLLDPWWNPAVEAQAVDRTHRIGQDKHVMVYRLVSAATIEDKVVALQERKRQLFATVVDDGALASGALTPDDIRALL